MRRAIAGVGRLLVGFGAMVEEAGEYLMVASGRYRRGPCCEAHARLGGTSHDISCPVLLYGPMGDTDPSQRLAENQ